MRFIVTIIWAALISSVVAYVLSSMAEATFQLTQALSLTVIISVVVFLLDATILREKEN